MSCKQVICDSYSPQELFFCIPYDQLAYSTHTIWTSDMQEVASAINNSHDPRVHTRRYGTLGVWHRVLDIPEVLYKTFDIIHCIHVWKVVQN